MTFEQLDLFLSEESSPLGGLARTCPSLAVVQVWRGNVQGCGLRLSGC